MRLHDEGPIVRLREEIGIPCRGVRLRRELRVGETIRADDRADDRADASGGRRVQAKTIATATTAQALAGSPSAPKFMLDVA